MAHGRETEEDVRGARPLSWVWERLTGTIATLVGMAGVGLLTGSIMEGAPMSDARAALVALLVYMVLCTLIVRVDRSIKDQIRVERVESEARRQRLRRPPYSVVDEAEAVLARVQGRRGAR